MPPNARGPAQRREVRAATAPADSRHGSPPGRATEHLTDDALDDRTGHAPQPTQPPGDLREVHMCDGEIHLPLPATFGITHRYGRRMIE